MTLTLNYIVVRKAQPTAYFQAQCYFIAKQLKLLKFNINNLKLMTNLFCALPPILHANQFHGHAQDYWPEYLPGYWLRLEWL